MNHVPRRGDGGSRPLHAVFAVLSLMVQFVVGVFGTHTAIGCYAIYGFTVLFVLVCLIGSGAAKPLERRSMFSERFYTLAPRPHLKADQDYIEDSEQAQANVLESGRNHRKQHQQSDEDGQETPTDAYCFEAPMIFFVQAVVFWLLTLIVSHHFFSIGLEFNAAFGTVLSWLLLSLTLVSCYERSLLFAASVHWLLVLLALALLMPSVVWTVQHTSPLASLFRLSLYWCVLFVSDYIDSSAPSRRNGGHLGALYIFSKSAWILVSHGTLLVAVFILFAFMFHAHRMRQTNQMQQQRSAPLTRTMPSSTAQQHRKRSQPVLSSVHLEQQAVQNRHQRNNTPLHQQRFLQNNGSNVSILDNEDDADDISPINRQPLLTTINLFNEESTALGNSRSNNGTGTGADQNINDEHTYIHHRPRPQANKKISRFENGQRRRQLLKQQEPTRFVSDTNATSKKARSRSNSFDSDNDMLSETISDEELQDIQVIQLKFDT